ncbi:TonB-dependent receptor plug domain-containing protein [Planctobacterium marinum]|uniref:TonB-dependent receptor n=1 Tax=Planctobacterium marinum TaxID=1631968 RepID=A0AA48HP08_9ALTE|nr:TonB-dependent receptor [Planctobacterium marinum]
MQRVFKLLLFVVALASFAVFGQEKTKVKQLLSMDLAELLKVEVATGTDKQLSEAPAVVSVITADDIAAMGARNLSEAIERIPGLHVMPSINRVMPLFSIRGISTDSTPQVLVLIDGVDISEMTALSTPYAFEYPIHAVERIEIIRGPGSAVYGADAFSGVINVITRKAAQQDKLLVGISAGSFDTFDGWLNWDKQFDELQIAFSVSHTHHNSDNNRVTQYGVMDRDGEISNIHLNLDYQNFSFKNWYWRTKQNMGTGAAIWGNNYDVDRIDAMFSKLSWSDALTDVLNASIDFSYGQTTHDARFQLLPPGVWPVGNDGNVFLPPFTPVTFPDGVIGQPSATTQKVELSSAFIYSGYQDHRIRVGFGAKKFSLQDVKEIKNFGPGILDVQNIPESLQSDALIDVTGTPFVYTPDYDRDLWFLSVQDEWKIDENWELTAGLRYDNYSDFGSTTNPRLALVWSANEAITAKFLFGTAFRAPKVAELAFVNNPTTLGNPTLQPEQIETLEFVIDYRPGDDFNGALNFFSYQAEDLIQLDQSFTFQNNGEQDGYGAELEANWQATELLRLSANLSWLESERKTQNVDKERVPGLMAFVDMGYHFLANWRFTMQGYWIADRQREPGDNRPEVDDYLKLDANLAWQIDEHWDATLSIKNLTDDNVVEPVPDSALFGIGLGFPGDYPMLSRSIHANVTYVF